MRPKSGSNTPKWGLPSTSKLSERCNVKENMLFSIKEKQVHHKNRRYCLKTKFYWHTEQRKQIKARWLTSFYFSYFNRDFFQQFSTEISDSIFFSRPHIIKGELGGNGYNSVCQASKEIDFFLFKSYFINVSYMDFTQNQVQSYRKNLPEKGKILKQSCFSVVSYLFCSRQLCKYNLTTQKKNFPLQCEVNISPFSELLQFAFYSFQFQSPSKTVWFEKRNVFQHKSMAKSKDCSNSEVKHARSLNWEFITLNCN